MEYNNNLNNALDVSADEGNEANVIKLINDGAEVNSKNETGHTPLHGACNKGHLNVAKILIENGANIDSHYKAANWLYVGKTKGFKRTRHGYTSAKVPKMVFLKPLRANAQALLSQDIIKDAYKTGGNKIMLKSEQMKSLPHFFADIPDPRRTQGRRHRLTTVLAISAGAVLCGMRGYKAISDWAKSLGAKARSRFGCRRVNGSYIVPSEYIIRNVLIRVDPDHLDRALQKWNEIYAKQDESLAIDGKTMCNAIDDQGRQTHIISVIGHESKVCHTQKKSAHCL